MKTNDHIIGFTTVCDWEHDGDYTQYEDILASIEDVRITDHENHGDGNTAYIYFECTEKSIIPLLQNSELDYLSIGYDYAKLLPEDFMKGFKILESETLFTSARLVDKIDSPLSWRYSISYETYLGEYTDKATLLKTLSELNLSPTHIYKGKYGFILFGTSTLENLVKTIYSNYTGDLSYYFTNKRYSDDDFRHYHRLNEAIATNFKEVICLPNDKRKEELSTKTEADNKRIAQELAGLEEIFCYFFKNRNELTQDYHIDYTGTTEQTLVMITQEQEGIKFNYLEFPFTVCKLKADKNVIELTDTYARTHQYRAGSKEMSAGTVCLMNESCSMTNHDIFIQVIYGIDVEYFY